MKIMKYFRALALVFSLLLTLSCVPMEVRAVETGSCGPNTEWTFDKETGVLEIDGYGYIKDKSGWKPYLSQIKEIKISSSISFHYYSGLFSGCSNLESITIPYVGISRKEEGDNNQYPFGSIFGVSSYPGSTKIYQHYYVEHNYPFDYDVYETVAFYIPSSLKHVTVTGGNILDGAFEGCKTLHTITLPKGLTKINRWAFYGCYDLKEIVIPSGVARIEKEAFSCCYDLTEIRIPKAVRYMGERVLAYCEDLDRVFFEGSAPTIESDAFSGVTCYAFYPVDNGSWDESKLQDYGGDITWIAARDGICAEEHSLVTLPGTKPTCTKPGISEGSYCSICNGTIQAQEEIPAAHSYSHEYDYKCDRCGEERAVDMTRPMVDMFRMYNPNTGEHFYTGSTVERDNLIGHGWQYEGVGFTFPLTTGDPVHRLFDPNTGEHLYTMDEKEMDALLDTGWNYEGIAFNSAFENEVPQYRLHNPNATVGAYHFTASPEERDMLLSVGWEDQGIGWYSLGAMP